MAAHATSRTEIILRLLAESNEYVSIAELQTILRGLGEPQSLIADKRQRRPALRDTEVIRAIADRLGTAVIVKGSRPEKWGQIRISLLRPSPWEQVPIALLKTLSLSMAACEAVSA